MILIMVAALALGLILGFVLDITYPTEYSFYITMALLAAMDSVIGAIRSMMEDKYDTTIFVSGFVTNALLAGVLTFVGDKLGVPLYYAAIFVFGGRLFNNLAAIRRMIIQRHRERKRQKM